MRTDAIRERIRRRETLRRARIAAYMNNHAEACRLYAAIGIPYCVEVQVYEERTS